MPSIVNVSGDGSVSLVTNDWTNPVDDPVVQELPDPPADFDLKRPAEPVQEGPPPVNAPKADWVDHIAATTDLTPEEAAAKTKADLIAQHRDEISRLEQGDSQP